MKPVAQFLLLATLVPFVVVGLVLVLARHGYAVAHALYDWVWEKCE